MERTTDSRRQITTLSSFNRLVAPFNRLVAVAALIIGLHTPVYAESVSPPPGAKAASDSNTVDVAPFVAEYDVDTDALPVSGTGSRSLKHLGDGHFRMEQLAKSFLLTRREISEFNMTNCDIEPRSYRYEQSGIGRDRRHLLDFHPEEEFVIYEANKNRSKIELPKTNHYYDRLSETLALQCLLLQRQADNVPQDTELELHVVDKGALRTHQFAITGEDRVRVADTDMHTIRVERVRDSDQRKTTLWFAPRQNYALVKMEHMNDGKTITFTLKSIKQVF